MKISLEPREIHLWSAVPERIPAASLVSWKGLLGQDEPKRLAAITHPERAAEFLIGRALLRSALSRYQPGIQPMEWRFSIGPQGRPELSGPGQASPLRFNLSHCDGLVVCAFCVGHDLGVDVENVGRRTDLEDVARSYFSPSELDDCLALPEPLRRARFFQYWTLKEAYIKARGMGLSLPLDQFSFRLGPAADIRISFAPSIEDEPEAWQFRLSRPGPLHQLALGVKSGVGAPPFGWVEKTWEGPSQVS